MGDRPPSTERGSGPDVTARTTNAKSGQREPNGDNLELPVTAGQHDHRVDDQRPEDGRHGANPDEARPEHDPGELGDVRQEIDDDHRDDGDRPPPETVALADELGVPEARADCEPRGHLLNEVQDRDEGDDR